MIRLMIHDPAEPVVVVMNGIDTGILFSNYTE